MLVLVTLFAACDGGESDGIALPPIDTKPVPDEDLKYSIVTNEVFRPACYECHSRATGVTEGNIGVDSLVEVRLNIPAIYDATVLERNMPPADKPPLTERQISLLKQWLEAGAPE